ncbi:tetratricopeptide repeat protein 39C-like [Crassostrea angulata]|uniref:Tetratricopeptide repeat protein 39C n=1 Tax=Magallana gigas TaxID=29159 RepID=A0A8W8NCF7_MAGGI|nr:tetratricopeptide repeat protein 39C [Crassostrea gigas]XP_052708904.1 tetratricopeptide repeat protein 39C-like [Crassostrea angulata]
MATNSTMTEMSTSESEDTLVGLDDSEMALGGISMLLNNGFEEARLLFEKYKNDSFLMNAGHSFVFFMQALMSFEDEKLEEAMKVLQETEKLSDTDAGVLKSIKNRFKSKKKREGGQISIDEKIQRQVIVADSLLYQAILVFTNQDIPSYIKGGWYLRKAWKIYEKLYKDVMQLQMKNAKLRQSENGPVDGNDNEMPQELLDRLQGAVSFGYGTFQICISMVPPKILKLIELFGFEGDRDAGLAALDYSSHSKDMKAPLATLGLLWYHTILRPFFALDGANDYSAGTTDAERIIEEKEAEFQQSPLFLFFRGRIHRLRKQTDKSLEFYQKALEAAKGQREVELMCQYELGWVNLMKLQWRESLQAFTRLKEETKWSKCYYTYLMGVSLGALGDVKGGYEILKEVPGLLKKKNNQIEAYVSRRAEKMKKAAPSQEYCRLLCLELIFLWHALPTCTAEELQPYLTVCDMQTDPKVFHIKCLIEGAVYKELGELEMAVQFLEEAIARQQGMKEDHHVSAFASFELASIYMRKPETAGKAKQLLQQIKDNYKDYDFENRLTVRVNNALKALKLSAKVG